MIPINRVFLFHRSKRRSLRRFNLLTRVSPRFEFTCGQKLLNQQNNATISAGMVVKIFAALNFTTNNLKTMTHISETVPMITLAALLTAAITDQNRCSETHRSTFSAALSCSFVAGPSSEKAKYLAEQHLMCIRVLCLQKGHFTIGGLGVIISTRHNFVVLFKTTHPRGTSLVVQNLRDDEIEFAVHARHTIGDLDYAEEIIPLCDCRSRRYESSPHDLFEMRPFDNRGLQNVRLKLLHRLLNRLPLPLGVCPLRRRELPSHRLEIQNLHLADLLFRDTRC